MEKRKRVTARTGSSVDVILRNKRDACKIESLAETEKPRPCICDTRLEIHDKTYPRVVCKGKH